MPATTRTRTPMAPLAKLMAGVLLLVPLAARAHDGMHPHPHGVEYIWTALVATLAVGAGWAIARWQR